MKKSINTFLKHTAQDKVNRSANPAVVRASTIFFKSMQELLKHKNPSKNKRVDYYDYGRAGTQTTTQLQNIIVELEQAVYMSSITKYSFLVNFIDFVFDFTS